MSEATITQQNLLAYHPCLPCQRTPPGPTPAPAVPITLPRGHAGSVVRGHAHTQSMQCVPCLIPRLAPLSFLALYNPSSPSLQLATPFLQIELRRKLQALESFFDDVPSPELVLSLVPAEVGALCAACSCVCESGVPDPCPCYNAEVAGMHRLGACVGGCCVCRAEPMSYLVLKSVHT